MDAKVAKSAQAQLAILALTEDQVQLALDEVSRELNVRERCFPRWVTDGRLSKSDAKDRLDRQIKAKEILQLVLDTVAEAVPM